MRNECIPRLLVSTETEVLLMRRSWLRSWLAGAVALQLAATLTGAALAASIDAQAVNDAQWERGKAGQGTVSAAIVKLQVLLDRAHFSPGEIDETRRELGESHSGLYGCT